MIQRFEKHYRFFHVFFLLSGVLTLLLPVHLYLNKDNLNDPIVALVDILGPSTCLVLYPLIFIGAFSYTNFFFGLISKASIPIRINLGLHSGFTTSIGVVIVLLFRFNPFSTVTPLVVMLLSVTLLSVSYYLIKRFDNIETEDESQRRESRFMALIGMSLGALLLIYFVFTVI